LETVRRVLTRVLAAVVLSGLLPDATIAPANKRILVHSQENRKELIGAS
jgi:hypothetical protein